MNIVKKCHHKGVLGDLSKLYSSFERIRANKGIGYWPVWFDSDTGHITFEKMIIFVGKTGYGKSTTLNAISGTELFQTSDVMSSTMFCQCVNYLVQGRYWISLVDLPGVGENRERDKDYINLYKNLTNHASVIIHVLRADTRDYSIDEEITKKLYNQKSIRNKIIYAIGQCDKIEPINRAENFAPTILQEKNIENKILEINRIFNPVNIVIPYSAKTRWNLNKLIEEITRITVKSD